MTIKEYKALSPGDRREANKDIAVFVLTIIGSSIAFALMLLASDWMANM